MKDPADFVRSLEPLGREQALAILNHVFFGEPLIEVAPCESSPAINAVIGMDWCEYLERDAREHALVLEEQSRILWRAMQLAPNIWTCRALLRGERVPWQALDYFVAERYGVRRDADVSDGRLTIYDFNDIPRP